MLRRLLEIWIAFLVLLDAIVCYFCIAPLYLFNVASKPTGTQLISSYIGEAYLNNMRWSIIPNLLINTLFLNKNHCVESYKKYGI